MAIDRDVNRQNAKTVIRTVFILLLSFSMRLHRSIKAARNTGPGMRKINLIQKYVRSRLLLGLGAPVIPAIFWGLLKKYA
jgi:hypothetical protein